MPKTYFAAGANTAAESWRTIRSLRADLPESFLDAFASDSERREVFQTGLEQAQQQFTAASLIGYESRPLNLFYGLAQAGRAIAAASGKLGAETGVRETLAWKGNGHGLSFQPDLGTKDFFDTSVEISKTRATKPLLDLFSRVSTVLTSPFEPGPVSLSGLVSQIPEFAMEFGPEDDALPALHLTGIYGMVPLLSYPVGIEVPLYGVALTEDVTDDEILESTSRYPALRGFIVARSPDTSVLSRSAGKVVLNVHSASQIRLPLGGSFYFPARALTYRRHELVFPQLGPSNDAFEPLMSWWLVLFSFSMIARYSPNSWTQTLSISSSPIASKVEFLLDTALDAVPDLIAEVLGRLT